jgi:hypothetical protein
MAEDNSAIVGVTLRIREDLRRSLEEAAKARRVSLNQEIIDRLEYVRDRQSLLAEVLRLTLGERLAGLVLAIGLAMGSVVHGYRHLSQGGARDQSRESWIDDREIFDEAAQAAIMLLGVARPGEGEPPRRTKKGRLGHWRAWQVLTALRDKPYSFVPAKEIEAIKELLGPVAGRMIAQHAAIGTATNEIRGEELLTDWNEAVAKAVAKYVAERAKHFAIVPGGAPTADDAAHRGPEAVVAVEKSFDVPDAAHRGPEAVVVEGKKRRTSTSATLPPQISWPLKKKPDR